MPIFAAQEVGFPGGVRLAAGNTAQNAPRKPAIKPAGRFYFLGTPSQWGGVAVQNGKAT